MMHSRPIRCISDKTLIVLASHQPIDKSFVKFWVDYCNKANSLVMQILFTIIRHQGRVTNCINFFTKISHSDNQITWLQYKFIRESFLIGEFLCLLEPTFKREVPWCEHKFSRVFISKILSFKSITMLYLKYISQSDCFHNLSLPKQILQILFYLCL